MPAIKQSIFGGMLPMRDPQLLPDAASQNARNVRLDGGSLKPVNEATSLAALTAGTRKVFRIPTGDVNDLSLSHWMEFTDPDTRIVRTPLVNDSFERYYWASPTGGIRYNSKARILANESSYRLGVEAPSVAPTVTPDPATGEKRDIVTVIDEGEFDAAKYLLDLGDVSDNILAVYRNYIYEHWLQAAQAGALLGDADTFDHEAWANTNPGLRDAANQATEQAAQDHYYTTGINEGRPFPDDGAGNFSAVRYVLDNPDISDNILAVYRQHIYQHWQTNGDVNNPPTLPNSATFDHETYAATVPGLREKAMEAVERAARDHYYLEGQYEGREFPFREGTRQTETTQEFVQSTVTRSYVYTYVNAFGEEGQPSPPAEAVGAIDQTWNVTVTQPVGGGERAPVEKIRIYRTITAASGTTTFFHVADLDLGTSAYADIETDSVVSGNNQLQSTLWAPPPEDLQGLISMPNGMFIGFKDSTIYVAENYRPHAWPVEYQVTVEYPIVGLGVFGSTCVVCTQGHPALLTGSRSASLTLQSNTAPLPCLSARSIVSTGVGVIYASESGLIVIGPGGINNITQELFGRYEWRRNYAPETISACVAEMKYLAVYTQGGTTQAFLFNPLNPAEGITILDGFTGDAVVATDPWSGRPLLVQGNAVSELLPTSGTPKTARWKSKQHQVPAPLNMAAGELFHDGSESDGRVRVWADYRLIYDEPFKDSGKTFRLPSGFKAEVWEYEIETRVRVHSLALSTTAFELRGA